MSRRGRASARCQPRGLASAGPVHPALDGTGMELFGHARDVIASAIADNAYDGEPIKAAARQRSLIRAAKPISVQVA